MIKKTSIEAADRFDVKEGLLGTVKRTADMDGCLVTEPNCEKYWRHDDCSFGDPGEEHPLPEDIGRTIQWYATLDIDNTWGGNNYETPETIGLGPIEDELDNATGQKTEDSDKDGRADGDGIPDRQREMRHRRKKTNDLMPRFMRFRQGLQNGTGLCLSSENGL